MTDALEKSLKLDDLQIEANEIIAKKHLHFAWFENTTTLYEYNCWVAKSDFYHKLSIREYDVLLIILKGKEERIKLLED